MCSGTRLRISSGAGPITAELERTGFLGRDRDSTASILQQPHAYALYMPQHLFHTGSRAIHLLDSFDVYDTIIV